MTDHRPHSTCRRTVQAALVGTMLALLTVVGAASAQAAPAPPAPRPTLVGQVPFVMPAWPAAGETLGVTATIWNVPTTATDSDVVAWVTCQGASVPSAYPVTKVLDHATRRMLLAARIESSRHDRDCTLNAVSTAIGTHIAFYPATINPSTGTPAVDGVYIVDGITAP